MAEKDHEVRQVALVLAEFSDHEHEVHAHHVTSEAEEKRLAETQKAGVTPEQVDGYSHDSVTQVFSPDIEREILDEACGIE